MSTALKLTLGISGHSHAKPRHIGLPPTGALLEFPAGWALIEHPVHGSILFDCGYGAAARTAMRRGLRWVYRQAIDACCEPHEDAAQLLAARGLQPHDIRSVVISHFHPDHIGGLRAFTKARYIAHADAWRQVRSGGWFNLIHAQIWRELLPADFEARLELLEPSKGSGLDGELAPFGNGWDVLGDGSLIAIDLPGHALGQIGLALTAQTRAADECVLLVADAFWRREQLDSERLPPRLTRWLAMHDRHRYQHTLQLLRQFRDRNPHAWIIPAHCADTISDWERRHPESVMRSGLGDTRSAA